MPVTEGGIEVWCSKPVVMAAENRGRQAFILETGEMESEVTITRLGGLSRNSEVA